MLSLKQGDKFGQLTVQKWNNKEKNWTCICNCGTITGARSWALKTGRHKRCYNCSKNAPRYSTRLPDNLGLKRDYYRLYKSSAIKRQYEFSLSECDFFNLIELDCHYCGSKPSEKTLCGHNYTTKRKGLFNGVDRIDNSVGYNKNNCVTCCPVCNNSKSTLSLEDWKQWIKRVYNKTIDPSV